VQSFSTYYPAHNNGTNRFTFFILLLRISCRTKENK